MRYDYFTYCGAAECLKHDKPRVLYISFGETDDWAHARRYDLYLDSARRTDEYIQRLWELVQSMPEYAGKTSFVLTTDHGRGETTENWISHGDEHPGSDLMWERRARAGYAGRAPAGGNGHAIAGGGDGRGPAGRGLQCGRSEGGAAAAGGDWDSENVVQRYELLHASPQPSPPMTRIEELMPSGERGNQVGMDSRTQVLEELRWKKFPVLDDGFVCLVDCDGGRRLRRAGGPRQLRRGDAARSPTTAG